ncbi:co-chaperone GroES [Candidatus Dojkabacteria bacterium]|nr:co-chaperone GroES [Candidatus Dojkabacteria bacterium]
MNIKPIGEYILVEPLEEEEKTASGLLIQSSGKGERPQRGKIAALGTGKRDDSGKLIDFNVEVGQEVLFKKYAPEDIELDGKSYLLMKESDILAVIN